MLYFNQLQLILYDNFKYHLIIFYFMLPIQQNNKVIYQLLTDFR